MYHASCIPRRPAALASRFLVALLVTSLCATAHAAGLDTATTNISEIETWIWVVVPVLCGIAGAVVWLCYASDLMRKETAIQWAIGIFGAGVLVPALIDIFF